MLDEFRAVFAWAVRNDKLAGPEHIPGGAELSEAPEDVEAEPDDDQRQELAEVVQDSLRDLASDLEEVVRDQLKQELSGFRDSVEQFSLDIQWAVRQVRQASDNRRAEAGECPTNPTTSSDAAPPTQPTAEPEPTSHSVPRPYSDDTRQSLFWWLRDWRRFDFDMPNNAGQTQRKQRRTESLWINW